MQAEFGGESLHHGEALVAERGQRAGGAAELDPERARAELVEALDVVGDRHQPGRDLEAERGVERVL